MFLPKDKNLQDLVSEIISSTINSSKTRLVFSRDVPINSDSIGEWSRDAMPKIIQLFVENTSDSNDDNFSRQLYIIRKTIER